MGAILELGRAMEVEVSAEGIEDDATRDRLVEMGCFVGQGYLFAMPMSAAEVVGFFAGAEHRLIA